MGSEDSARIELGGTFQEKQTRYCRAICVPPTTVGAQSDASAMKARRYGVDHLAKAIQTIHLSDQDTGKPMHSMMLICLDGVHRQAKFREGRCISHKRALQPRLNHIFDYAFNILQTTLNNDDDMHHPSPIPDYIFVGVRYNLSLMEVVQEYNLKHKISQQLETMKASQQYKKVTSHRQLWTNHRSHQHILKVINLNQ